MKKLFILIIASTSYLFSFGQDNDYAKPFSQIVAEKKAYFNQLKLTKSQEEFNAEGGEYEEYLKWLDYWKPRIAPDKTIQQYNTNISKYVAPRTKSLGNTDSWKELGPFDEPILGSMKGIGIIGSLAINRINPNKLLANSLAGGLYYSVDKGLNWTNAGSDKWWRSGCTTMSFDPNNETTWYAASNLGGIYGGYLQIGALGGLYRTTNSGLTWSLILDVAKLNNFDFPPGKTADFLQIKSIKIDKSNSSKAYLATNFGLYISNNINDITPSAVIWTKVSSSVIANNDIEDIEIKVGSPLTVVVSHKDLSGNWHLSYSTDGGTNWALLPNQNFVDGPITEINPNPTNQIIIEVSENSPNTLFVREKKSPYSLRLKKYDFGTTIWWTSPVNMDVWNNAHAFGVSNVNANIIYMTCNYSPVTFNNRGVRLAKSIDGGNTFSLVNDSYHDDQDDIVFPSTSSPNSTPNEVYLTNHGGVYYSNNMTTFTSRFKGLGIARVVGSSNSETNPEVISIGLDHDGTDFSDGTYGSSWIPTWKNVRGCDGGATRIDYSNSRQVFFKCNDETPSITLDGGLTYQASNFTFTGSWISDVVQNSGVPSVVYCMAKPNSGSSADHHEIDRSQNFASTSAVTEQITDFESMFPLPFWPQIQSIFSANSDPNVMYATVGNSDLPEPNNNQPGAWQYRLYRTNKALNYLPSDTKTSWVEMPMHNNNNAIVLAVNNKNANIVYITDPGPGWALETKLYIYDYSNPNPVASKIDISGVASMGGLPDVAIISLVLEKGSNGGIYVSNDLGVYYANNTTLNFTNNSLCIWTKIGSNLPNIPMGKLEINYVANKIRVSTPGRGVWEHDLFCPSANRADYSGIQNANAYYEMYNDIKSTAIIGSTVGITYRAGTFEEFNTGFYASPSNSGFFEAYIHPCMYIGTSPLLKNHIESGSSDGLETVQSNFELKPEISLYPNPIEGSFTLNIANEDLYDVVIYNNLGKEMLKLSQVQVNKLNIDFSKFESGFYVARCSNDHDYKSISFVKK